jgi:hypothetical protein
MITLMLAGGVAVGGLPAHAQDTSNTVVVHNAPVPNGQQSDQQGTVSATPAEAMPGQDQAPPGEATDQGAPGRPGMATAPNGQPTTDVTTVQSAPKPYGPAGPQASTAGSVAANAPGPGQPYGIPAGAPVAQATIHAPDGSNLGGSTIAPQSRSSVRVTVDLPHAPPGTYSVSLHRGTCTRPGRAYGRELMSLQPGPDGGAHGQGVATGLSAAQAKGAIVVVTGPNGTACGFYKALVG